MCLLDADTTPTSTTRPCTRLAGWLAHAVDPRAIRAALVRPSWSCSCLIPVRHFSLSPAHAAEQKGRVVLWCGLRRAGHPALLLFCWLPLAVYGLRAVRLLVDNPLSACPALLCPRCLLAAAEFCVTSPADPALPWTIVLLRPLLHISMGTWIASLLAHCSWSMT